MKRIGNLYYDFCSDENIEKAYFAAIKGKTKRRDVQEIIKDKNNKLLYIKNNIHTWCPSPYKVKFIKDKKKVRELHIPPFFPDRIIHHMINNILEKVFLPTLITDTYQCIKGRGVHKAIDKTAEYVKNSDWVLKIDVKKYYPSIDNNLLKNKLQRKIKDKYFLNILYKLIDSNKGLPIGNHTSQLLGNIFLSDFDYIMKRISSKYIRYADDMILFGTKAEVKLAYTKTIFYLKQNNLNISKLNYVPTNVPFTFLGFRFIKTPFLFIRPIKRTLRLSIQQNKNKNSVFGWVTKPLLCKCSIFIIKLYTTINLLFLYKYLNKNFNKN